MRGGEGMKRPEWHQKMLKNLAKLGEATTYHDETSENISLDIPKCSRTLDKAVEALRFYGDKETHHGFDFVPTPDKAQLKGCSRIFADDGQKAREFLKEYEDKK